MFPPLPQTVEAYREYDLTEGARNPGTWVADARQLHAAGKHVLQGKMALNEPFRYDTAKFLDADYAAKLSDPLFWATPVFMMLSGMALEVLAKAQIIATDPSVIEPGNPPVLERSLKSHNLIRLWQRAAIPTDAAERQFLEKLTHYIRWAGRYPISTVASDMELRPESEAIGVIRHPGDPEMIDRLYERALAVVFESCQRLGRQRAEEEEMKLKTLRLELGPWLAESTTRVEGAELVAFVANEPNERPRALIGCTGCSSSIYLDGETRAQICPCDRLHYIEWYVDELGIPRTMTWSMPPA